MLLGVAAIQPRAASSPAAPPVLAWGEDAGPDPGRKVFFLWWEVGSLQLVLGLRIENPKK